MANHAVGPFDVKVVKQDDPGGDNTVGRFTLDKQYHGDLEGTGKGQTINIVPDSGTGQLKGIAGKMTITITAEGKHTYDVEYTLPN